MSGGGYRLTDVTKSYSGRQILHVDRLEVERGELLCLVGPTGAGKSTLLRLLAGVERPSSGRMLYGEHDFAAAEPPLTVQQGITLVFQRPLLLNRTVWDNVDYGLRLRGAGAGPERIRAIMDRLALSGLATQSARKLSGGQAQLVALARALVLEPDVLLLDEPTSGLDPGRVALVEEVVREIQQARGTTVVWSTHNIFQARRIARRAALLLEGRLVEAAPADVFFASPANAATAAFVRGEMIY